MTENTPEISAKIHRKCGLKHDDNSNTKRIAQTVRIQKMIDASSVVDNNETLNVKIIVHICFQEKETPNISQDVQEMIDTLNRDYNKKASNFNNYGQGYVISPNNKELKEIYDKYISLAGSANINFLLNKIIYKKFDIKKCTTTQRVMYNYGDLDTINKLIKVKHSPSIDADKFLNIWIVENLGGGLLGYATFPWDFNELTKCLDGVVINRGTFGKNASMRDYNLNKTVTHEVGHWFGLFHVFQNTLTNDPHKNEFAFDYNNNKLTEEEITGDCIEDTPPQNCATYGDPFIDKKLWQFTNYKNTKSWHMFMNFMDYVDDKSMFMFTKDQCKKLRLMLMLERPNIIKSIS